MARVLVVDDEAHVRELIGAILEADGHDVRTASDGREALTALESGLPDLIVLDLAMPGMDGWAFLDQLHARGLRRQTRVLIVSGRYDPATVTARQRSAMGRFLRKPFEPQELSALVTQTLAEEPDELYVRHERAGELAKLIRKVDDVLG